MTKNQIRKIALACGFKLKGQPDGNMDLNPYVYDFANELLRISSEEIQEELNAERDALAAHMERLKKAALDATFLLPGGEVKAELRDAYDEAPETSLARRDLIKKAEALEEASNEFMVHERARMILKWNAERIRRHAEDTP